MDNTNIKNGPTLWAIDPFESRESLSHDQIKILIDVSKRPGVSILPIYVLPLNVDILEEIEAYENLSARIVWIREQMELKLKNWGVTQFKSPHLLIQQSASSQAHAKELSRYAEEQAAPLIVLSSSGGKAFSRMVLGSFADSLLKTTSLPVLILHEGVSRPTWKHESCILFLTDFSPLSLAAFYETIKIARIFNMSLRLLHVACVPSVRSITSHGEPIRTELLEEETKAAKQTIAKMCKYGNESGIATQGMVKNGGLYPNLSDYILDAANKYKACILSIASQSGRFATFFMGSTARETFENSPVPIICFGPMLIQKRIQKHRRLTDISLQV